MTSVSTCDLPYKQDSTYYFEKIRHLPYAVFIDSGASQIDTARYDIISASPALTVESSLDKDSHLIDHDIPAKSSISGDDGMEIINQTIKSLSIENATDLPFVGGFIGLMSYPHTSDDERLTPDLLAGLYHWAIVTDHSSKTTSLVHNDFCNSTTIKQILNVCRSTQETTKDASTTPFTIHSGFQSNLTKKTYEERFTKIKRYLLNGDCYQVNLAQRFESTYSGEPWSAYQALRKRSPSPYSAFLAFKDFQVLSLSPEQFLGLKSRTVTTRPIKGTCPRHPNPETDNQLKMQLFNSEKNRAENLMIVDLLRNDLGRSCKTGSINVLKLFDVESYTNVHHLVSTIKGTLNEDRTVVDLLQNAFPGGSITGAPKKRAMEIIEELEPNSRGPYCGSVFYLSLNGNADSNIAIRTLLCRENKIYCWGGGGIVADSNCEEEYAESVTKISHLMSALESNKASQPIKK